jgi:hypothetical protein
MKNRDRFLNTLNFTEGNDRLPVIEWANYWNATTDRWKREGLSEGKHPFDVFGLDAHKQLWIRPMKKTYPNIKNGVKMIVDGADYEKLKEHLYPESLNSDILKKLNNIKEGHENGDYPVWLTLEGFFGSQEECSVWKMYFMLSMTTLNCFTG